MPLPAKVYHHRNREELSTIYRWAEMPTLEMPAMAKNNNKDTQVVRRDSDNGQFITRREAERKDPATWEREHIHHPKKK